LGYGYKVQPMKALFSRGFYGVDIFLFFSALGCSFSYNKNKLSTFYGNRLHRVLPLFYVLVLFRIYWEYYSGKSINVLDVLATITGLSYFRILGGFWVDWYLCALLLLYALFPSFYKFIRKYETWGVICVSVVSTMLCFSLPMAWDHYCLIGRLPIFALGIWFYLKRNSMTSTDVSVLKILVTYGLLLFAFDLLIPNDRTRFLAPAFVAPLLILAITLLYQYLSLKSEQVVALINFIGKHSLEIYVANCITGVVCHKGLELTGYGGVMIEFVWIAALSVILFWVNKMVLSPLKV